MEPERTGLRNAVSAAILLLLPLLLAACETSAPDDSDVAYPPRAAVAAPAPEPVIRKRVAKVQMQELKAPGQVVKVASQPTANKPGELP